MGDEEIRRMLSLVPQDQLIECFLLPLMKSNKSYLLKLKRLLLTQRGYSSTRERQQEHHQQQRLTVRKARRAGSLVRSRITGRTYLRSWKSLRQEPKAEEGAPDQPPSEEKEVESILWFPSCPNRIKTMILSLVDPVESEGSIFLVCKEWNDLWKQSEIWEMAYLNRWLDTSPSDSTTASTFAAFFANLSLKVDEGATDNKEGSGEVLGDSTTAPLEGYTKDEERKDRDKGKEKDTEFTPTEASSTTKDMGVAKVDFKQLFVERYEIEKRWHVEEVKHLSLGDILPSAPDHDR